MLAAAAAGADIVDVAIDSKDDWFNVNLMLKANLR